MAVDKQSMQRAALRILLKDAVDCQRRLEDVQDSDDEWHRSCVHLEFYEALSKIRGIAYVRYGVRESSKLYQWANKYYGMPYKFECHLHE